MTRRGISRLLSDYGMGLVLLLLCVYYSWATIQTRQLSGTEAADQVAKKITKTNPVIVLVAGTSPDDQAFAESLKQKLKLKLVAHDPPSARATIQELIAGGRV